MLTDDELWLAAADGKGGGFAEHALEARPLVYKLGALGDRLQLGGRTLSVPTGRGDKALAILARARLRPPAQPCRNHRHAARGGLFQRSGHRDCATSQRKCGDRAPLGKSCPNKLTVRGVRHSKQG